MKYKFLEIKDSNKIRVVTLNRPEVHNAFNDEFIQEMVDVFTKTSKESEIQIVVINSNGKSFCAGADLNWMKKMIDYSLEENKEDSFKLVKLFDSINDLPQFVVGVVQGHVFGGGLGIVAACDYVMSLDTPLFSFSEVRLGLLPAVISKYTYPKMGYSNARAYMSSGLRFDAHKAKEMNLVHEVTHDLNASLDKLLISLLKAAPNSMRKAKDFCFQIDGYLNQENYDDWSVSVISKLRISDEGQEGMNALLEKRSPSWVGEK